MYGAVGESGGRRDGRDESDLIKFLRAETRKMIRREVREVREDSEGGSGGEVGRGRCAAIGRECTSAESATELQSGPHLSGTAAAALVIGASCGLVGGKRFLLFRTSEHKRKAERKRSWHAFKQRGLISQLGSG